MKGIVLPNMCWIFSSIYTGGFLATVLYLLSWTGECLFKMHLSLAHNRATFTLSRLPHKSELKWSSGQRRSIVIRWREVESPCLHRTELLLGGPGKGEAETGKSLLSLWFLCAKWGVHCTGEIFIVFSMDHEKMIDSYKTSHAVWGRARFARSISLNQMRFCLDTVYFQHVVIGSSTNKGTKEKHRHCNPFCLN